MDIGGAVRISVGVGLPSLRALSTSYHDGMDIGKGNDTVGIIVVCLAIVYLFTGFITNSVSIMRMRRK